MDYPTFTVSDVAEYSGRPLVSYPSFAAEALAQATLLFKVASCLTEWPELVNDQDLAKYAILSMTDAVVIAQPYQKVLASPFQSETIGSYSYSKSAQTLARMGSQIHSEVPTGVFWFDLAITRLGVCEVGAGIYSGSIGVMEYGNDIRPDETSDNDKQRLYGPADIDPVNIPFYISSDESYSGQP